MAGPTSVTGLRRLIQGVRRGAVKPRVSPDVSAYLDDLARSPEMAAVELARQQAKLDRHFERPENIFAGVDVEVPMSRQLADADVGLFGNPAVQRMLKDAEYQQAIGPMEGEDVMEMLRRNDRVNTLAGVNARRYGGERGQLWDIAQDNITRSRDASRRAAGASENSDMIADSTLGAAVGMGAMAAAGLVGREMDEDRDLGRFSPNVPTDLYPPSDVDFTDDPSIYLEPTSATELADEIPPVGAEVYMPPEDAQQLAAALYPDVYDWSMEGVDFLKDIRRQGDQYAEEAMGQTPTAQEVRMMNSGDGYFMGKPNIDGFDDLSQARLDTLIANGVDPARAIGIIRRRAPMRPDEMEVLRRYGKGEMSW